MIPNTVALEEYLAPLRFALDDKQVSEILINHPGHVWVERSGGIFSCEVLPTFDSKHLTGLANLVARHSDQQLNETKPLLSGILPDGHRIQVILPPATEQGRTVLAIRRQTIANLKLDDYVAMGAFNHTKSRFLNNPRRDDTEEDSQLQALFNENNYSEFLKAAIIAKKNILISGATSTGKTTFLNACLQEIPHYEHIVTLEDVREVKPSQPLHTPLLTSKGLQGVAQVSMQDLVQASLRIRPDRIIMGELRGSEATDFINATATGHDGSLSSIHAASPYMAFMRLVHLVKLSGTSLSREDILEDLHTVIDVVVQLKRRMIDNKLTRDVSEIYYASAKPQ